MKILILLFLMLSTYVSLTLTIVESFKIIILICENLQVSAQGCTDGDRVKLQRGLFMVCQNGTWIEHQTRGRSGPSAPPCEDDPAHLDNGSCSANRENCYQYTVKGAEMDRDCPGTCGQMLSRQI